MLAFLRNLYPILLLSFFYPSVRQEKSILLGAILVPLSKYHTVLKNPLFELAPFSLSSIFFLKWIALLPLSADQRLRYIESLRLSIDSNFIRTIVCVDLLLHAKDYLLAIVPPNNDDLIRFAIDDLLFGDLSCNDLPFSDL